MADDGSVPSVSQRPRKGVTLKISVPPATAESDDNDNIMKVVGEPSNPSFMDLNMDKSVTLPRRTPPSRDDDDHDVLDAMKRRYSAPVRQTSGPGFASAFQRRNTIPRSRQTPTEDEQDGDFMPTPLEPQIHFMESITRKKILDIQDSLQDNPNLNLHLYTDNFGMSALHQAVNTGDFRIVHALIDRCQSEAEKYDVTHHAILFAIQENRISILEELLDTQDSLRKSFKLKSRLSRESRGEDAAKRKSHSLFKSYIKKEDEHLVEHFPREHFFDDAEYSSDVTPLVLATNLERHDIIKLLISRGDDDIHPFSQPCTKKRCCICKSHKGFKDRQALDKSRKLLEIYRALSSPAYLFQCGIHDPVLESFMICGRVQRLKDEYPAYQSSFDEIDSGCRHFTWDMIDLCRDTEEVETLLSRMEGYTGKQLTRLIFPRIPVALHYNQREFLAHPNCQQLLQRAWFEGLPDYFCKGRSHTAVLLLYFILWVFALPILSFIYSFQLSSHVRAMMRHPFNRFLSDTGSYLAFLLLILFDASVTVGTDDRPTELPFITQWLIILWVSGMTLRYVKVMYRKKGSLEVWHLTHSLKDGSALWYLFDLFWLLSFWFYVIMRAVGIAIHWSERESLRRADLDEFDPLLWSECAYAIAIIFSFARTNALMKASSGLGPLQISLTMMLRDIMLFMVIFVVTMLAFVVAVTKLYAPYRTYLDAELQESYADHYTNFWRTFTALFWALFNFGDVNDAGLVVPRGNGTADHVLTQTIGYTLVGWYHVIAIIVLLNMLIAMMSHSFNEIQANCDMEWKLARTKLRMSYFCEVGALPPPFNLSPMRYLINILRVVVAKVKKSDSPRFDPSASVRISGQTHSQAKERHKYSTLMRRLAQRYWNRRRVQGRKDGSDSVQAQHQAARRARRHMFPSWISCSPLAEQHVSFT